jgi:hypothetical protein
MTPTDFQQNKVAEPPAHFNTLPSTLPAYN